MEHNEVDGARGRKSNAGADGVGRASSQGHRLVEHVGRMSKAIPQMADGDIDIDVSEQPILEILRNKFVDTEKALEEMKGML